MKLLFNLVKNYEQMEPTGNITFTVQADIFIRLIYSYEQSVSFCSYPSPIILPWELKRAVKEQASDHHHKCRYAMLKLKAGMYHHYLENSRIPWYSLLLHLPHLSPPNSKGNPIKWATFLSVSNTSIGGY